MSGEINRQLSAPTSIADLYSDIDTEEEMATREPSPDVIIEHESDEGSEEEPRNIDNFDPAICTNNHSPTEEPLMQGQQQHQEASPEGANEIAMEEARHQDEDQLQHGVEVHNQEDPAQADPTEMPQIQNHPTPEMEHKTRDIRFTNISIHVAHALVNLLANLVCCICHEIMPVLDHSFQCCPSGHLVCVDCLDIDPVKPYRCGLCRKPTPLTTNLAAKNILQELKNVPDILFYCVNKSNGCNFVGTLEEKQLHDMSCRMYPTRCITCQKCFSSLQEMLAHAESGICSRNCLQFGLGMIPIMDMVACPAGEEPYIRLEIPNHYHFIQTETDIFAQHEEDFIPGLVLNVLDTFDLVLQFEKTSRYFHLVLKSFVPYSLRKKYAAKVVFTKPNLVLTHQGPYQQQAQFIAETLEICPMGVDLKTHPVYRHERVIIRDTKFKKVCDVNNHILTTVWIQIYPKK